MVVSSTAGKEETKLPPHRTTHDGLPGMPMTVPLGDRRLWVVRILVQTKQIRVVLSHSEGFCQKKQSMAFYLQF